MRPRLEDEIARASDDRLRSALIRQRALGVQLRHRWNDIAREPLPDEFRALLDQIDAREKPRERKKGRPSPKARVGY